MNKTENVMNVSQRTNTSPTMIFVYEDILSV